MIVKASTAGRVLLRQTTTFSPRTMPPQNQKISPSGRVVVEKGDLGR